MGSSLLVFELNHIMAADQRIFTWVDVRLNALLGLTPGVSCAVAPTPQVYSIPSTAGYNCQYL